jgi:hypothetical protein
MINPKVIVGSVGGAAFAVFVATAPLYFFTTPSHPRAVFWSMAGSAVLCLACIIVWLCFAASDRRHSKAIQSINTGGGDNSGAQMSMSAGHDFYYYPPAAPPPVESVRPAPPPAVEETIARKITATAPTLKINRRTEQVIFDYMQSGWRLAHQWEPESQAALVLWVENVFPTHGSARDLPNLIASIRAEQFDSITIRRAYWLQCRDNEVHLTSGSRLGVLVGHFSGRDSFVSFSNPHATSFQHILDDGFHPLGEKAKLSLILRDSDTAPLRIVVTIAQMPSQTVIACKRLIITLPQHIVDMSECE